MPQGDRGRPGDVERLNTGTVVVSAVAARRVEENPRGSIVLHGDMAPGDAGSRHAHGCIGVRTDDGNVAIGDDDFLIFVDEAQSHDRAPKEK